MKIDQIITRLEEIKTSKGNVDVVVWNKSTKTFDEIDKLISVGVDEVGYNTIIYTKDTPKND